MSEGGYEQTASRSLCNKQLLYRKFEQHLLPLVSIRLASTALGAVVLLKCVKLLPTTTDNYEIAIIKNATLTGASYSAVTSDANVEFDVTATAISGGTLVYSEFLTSRSGRSALSGADAAFNFDLQLGASLAGVSDVYHFVLERLLVQVVELDF
jgi:uncharacterized membrane protein (UPF0182 family)